MSINLDRPIGGPALIYNELYVSIYVACMILVSRLSFSKSQNIIRFLNSGSYLNKWDFDCTIALRLGICPRQGCSIWVRSHPFNLKNAHDGLLAMAHSPPSKWIPSHPLSQCDLSPVLLLVHHGAILLQLTIWKKKKSMRLLPLHL